MQEDDAKTSVPAPCPILLLLRHPHCLCNQETELPPAPSRANGNFHIYKMGLAEVLIPGMCLERRSEGCRPSIS